MKRDYHKIIIVVPWEPGRICVANKFIQIYKRRLPDAGTAELVFVLWALDFNLHHTVQAMAKLDITDQRSPYLLEEVFQLLASIL